MSQAEEGSRRVLFTHWSRGSREVSRGLVTMCLGLFLGYIVRGVIFSFFLATVATVSAWLNDHLCQVQLSYNLAEGIATKKWSFFSSFIGV